MTRRWVFGAAALVTTTSCLPREAAPVAAPRVAAKPITDPALLLRKLDLAPAAADLPPTAPVAGPDLAAPAFRVLAQTPDDAARAADCLTAAVYYEARSEPVDGQRAVAQVVLNRVRDRAFPSSVCGVVYQGSERRTGCQFSFTCDGSMLRQRDPLAWARSRVVADAALAGEVYAPVGSATFYHADYVLPWWASSLSQVGRVGTHIFYRWRGAMERALAFRQAYSGAEPLPRATSETAEVTADGMEVTIHRGLAPAEPAQSTLVAGVRIHRGGLDEEEAPLPAGALSVGAESAETF